MRSDTIKKGFERAPHRSLLRATGQIRDRGDFDKPFVAVCNSYVDIIPGHVHLQEFGRVVKEAVRAAGGVPFEFNTIGVDDGIAMGHEGMRYSLPSRELIADSVETMVQAHCFDAMVCIPNCDKIVPGMLMGAARANIPTIFVSGGPMAAGVDRSGQKVDLISVFEAVGARASGAIDDARLEELEIGPYHFFHKLRETSSRLPAKNPARFTGFSHQNIDFSGAHEASVHPNIVAVIQANLGER